MKTLTVKAALAPLSALLALAYLIVMWAAGAPPERTHLIKYEAKGVMAVDPESIVHVETHRQGNSAAYDKRHAAWIETASGRPLPETESKALALAVKFMKTANPVRVFKPNEIPAGADREFGLETPALTVRLATAKGPELTAHFGNLSSDGFLHYMKVDGRPEIFLMSRFVLAEWLKVGQAPK